MPCDMSAKEVMREQGILETEIELLEKEIALARKLTEKQSLEANLSIKDTVHAVEIAEQIVREIAHERIHARLRSESKLFFHELHSLVLKKDKVNVN